MASSQVFFTLYMELVKIEAGDYDTFNDVVMKVSYFYGYTDVVGLSEKDFEKLRNLL